MAQTEIKTNTLCPCDSGKRYGNCCKKKKLKWLVDENGDYHKSIPISAEVREVLEHASEDYQRIFERSPNKLKDPVFLTRFLMSDEEVLKQTTETLERSDISPEFIYAHRKTRGLILTRDNEQLMTTKDVEEWNDAIDEYFYFLENPPEKNKIDILFEAFEEELDNCIICIGYILEYGLKENAERIPSSSELFFVDDYVLLCATKSAKTLRSIKTLVREDIGADCLALARHIYENYLHILFALNRPEKLADLVDAVVGLKTGTHEYERKKDGGINNRKIVRKSDGSVSQPVSTHKMVESSNHDEDLALFDYLYSFLSEYTHPSFTGFELLIKENGNLDPLSNELANEAIFFSICFVAMILDEIKKLNIISLEMKKDIQTVTKRIGRKAKPLLNEMSSDDSPLQHIRCLDVRLAKLGMI